MIKLFTLGNLYVSDFIGKNESPRGGKSPLTIILDESIGAVRLSDSVDPDKMYGQYWYRSGINSTMTQELKGIAEELPSLIKISQGDIFLDIASNDGTLLKYVTKDMIRVGIDPADDSYLEEAKNNSDDAIQNYFSEDVYRNSKYGQKNAKIITTIAMFYDIESPLKFLKDVYNILDNEGLFVLQLSYTPLMLKQLAFDNICHEHIYYYSLTSMINLLNQVDMKVVDCTLNDINGGSFRIYVRKNCSTDSLFKTTPFRDVAQFRIDSLLELEKKMGITTPYPYLKFYKEICKLKMDTINFIHKIKKEGKTIWGYGASTKGNTLLQWYGLDHTIIDGIAERSPYKFGLKTAGTNIPIYSEEEMRIVNPDYILILPWHFINEFKQREATYLKNGGKFIVPCPKFEVIEGEK
jgi:hypothetical protein